MKEEIPSNDRRRRVRSLLPLCAWIALGAVALQAQQRGGPARRNSSPEGHSSFAARCASCHGLDGRGTERAPDIATRKEVLRLSDAALVRAVTDGVAGTGMPSFRALGKDRIELIVSYLRVLQGKGAQRRMPGDPVEGKALFHAKAECSTCHVIQGVGGFIGADLTNFAATQSAEDIRRAITQPTILGNRANNLLVVTMADGTRLTGVVRNEDNFSLQLQTLEGAFYSLSKAECHIEFSPRSIMPTDYSSRLSSKELDHLVSYLMDVAQRSVSQSDRPNSSSRGRKSQTDSD